MMSLTNFHRNSYSENEMFTKMVAQFMTPIAMSIWMVTLAITTWERKSLTLV